ncbi:MAG: hypothetical protein AN485_22465, partial [Anabaena sp. MDT14b]
MAILNGSDPSSDFSALTAQAVAAAGPDPDPAKLARVLEAITANQAVDEHNGPWPFSEAITTIKFVRRVFSADPELRATLASQFLTGTDKDPGLVAERLSLFANTAAKLLELEAEPLLEAVTLADATLDALWRHASAPPGAGLEAIEKATEFWAKLAAECDFKAQAVPMDLWEAPDNLATFMLSEHPRSARRIRQYWAELRDWALSADMVNVLATLVVRCKTEVERLGADNKADATRTVPRAASDISQSHDASARDFVQKHFRSTVGTTHVLDTAEGPINFARDLMSLTRTALFSGQSLGNVAAFMAQKAAAYDHDWVPVLADGGIKA